MNFINPKKKVQNFMLSKKIEKNHPLRSYKSKEKVDGFCSMFMGFVPSPYCLLPFTRRTIAFTSIFLFLDQHPGERTN